MARPQVADGGDGLQLGRVAANILNKKSWRTVKEWSSNLGYDLGLQFPTVEIIFLKNNMKDFGLPGCGSIKSPLDMLLSEFHLFLTSFTYFSPPLPIHV
jgi:hypothetical protein